MPLTSKQRAVLRAQANPINVTLQIGKEGLTPAVIRQATEILEHHELMKIRVLESALLTPREACGALCEALAAEPVQVIGSCFVIFKENPEKRAKLAAEEKKKKLAQKKANAAAKSAAFAKGPSGSKRSVVPGTSGRGSSAPSSGRRGLSPKPTGRSAVPGTLGRSSASKTTPGTPGRSTAPRTPGRNPASQATVRGTTLRTSTRSRSK